VLDKDFTSAVAFTDMSPRCRLQGAPIKIPAQTVGWIKMLLGTEVNLGPGDIVYGDI